MDARPLAERAATHLALQRDWHVGANRDSEGMPAGVIVEARERALEKCRIILDLCCSENSFLRHSISPDNVTQIQNAWIVLGSIHIDRAVSSIFLGCRTRSPEHVFVLSSFAMRVLLFSEHADERPRARDLLPARRGEQLRVAPQLQLRHGHPVRPQLRRHLALAQHLEGALLADAWRLALYCRLPFSPFRPPSAGQLRFHLLACFLRYCPHPLRRFSVLFVPSWRKHARR